MGALEKTKKKFVIKSSCGSFGKIIPWLLRPFVPPETVSTPTTGYVFYERVDETIVFLWLEWTRERGMGIFLGQCPRHQTGSSVMDAALTRLNNSVLIQLTKPGCSGCIQGFSKPDAALPHDSPHILHTWLEINNCSTAIFHFSAQIHQKLGENHQKCCIQTLNLRIQ